jgi:hypothetical protein
MCNRTHDDYDAKTQSKQKAAHSAGRRPHRRYHSIGGQRRRRCSSSLVCRETELLTAIAHTTAHAVAAHAVHYTITGTAVLRRLCTPARSHTPPTSDHSFTTVWQSLSAFTLQQCYQTTTACTIRVALVQTRHRQRSPPTRRAHHHSPTVTAQQGSTSTRSALGRTEQSNTNNCKHCVVPHQPHGDAAYTRQAQVTRSNQPKRPPRTHIEHRKHARSAQHDGCDVYVRSPHAPHAHATSSAPRSPPA